MARVPSQQKDLIHADVKGVGTKRVNDLVHQLEDDRQTSGLSGPIRDNRYPRYWGMLPA